MRQAQERLKRHFEACARWQNHGIHVIISSADEDANKNIEVEECNVSDIYNKSNN